MAVVTLKSATITNRDALPRIINDGRLERGVMKSFKGFVTAANGDSIGSKYIIGAVPSTAIVRQLLLSCDAITSSATDVGVYRPTSSDGTAGTVVSANLFSAAFSIAAARTAYTDVTNQGGTYSIDKQEQPLWQAAGLTADPGGTFDIVFTLTAATTASGRVGLIGHYVDNGS